MTQEFRSPDGLHVFAISLQPLKIRCTCSEWSKVHFCDWALEILGPPATQQLALGTVVSAAIQAMRMRSPDLAVDIGELHGDWKDEKIFGKKFLDQKIIIGNRILSRRFCEPDRA